MIVRAWYHNALTKTFTITKKKQPKCVYQHPDQGEHDQSTIDSKTASVPPQHAVWGGGDQDMFSPLLLTTSTDEATLQEMNEHQKETKTILYLYWHASKTKVVLTHTRHISVTNSGLADQSIQILFQVSNKSITKLIS